MSTAKFNQWLNPDGTENYKCRAWVNFNGTGTVAIRASGNVSSITDNGTGDYTANFTTAMPDANYSFSGDLYASTGYISPMVISSVASAAFRAVAKDNNGNAVDVTYGSLSFFR